MDNLNLYKEMLQTTLFREGPIVVFIWENSDGWPVVDVSPNIQSSYGYEVEAYIHQHLKYSDQIHPEDLERVFTEVTQASLSKENTFSHQPYRYLNSKGQYHWVQDSTTIIRDKNNKITHYVGYLTDITRYVDSNALLLEKNRWYKELFDLSPLGIALNKISGEFMDLNNALHSMCGYTKEAFVNLSYWDITPIEYEKQELEQLKSLETKGMYGPYKKEYIHKDGHRFPVLLSGIKNIDKEGNEYIWSVIQDITELTEANEKTIANELKFRSVFEHANDGMLIIKEGVFAECNEKALQILDYKESDILGLTPVEISPKYQKDGAASEAKAENILSKVVSGIPQVFSWTHLDKNGKPVDVEVSLSAVENGDESFMLCLWRDISERQQILQSLQEEKEKADYANASKSRFLANMSHEIRTPMNGILGFVDILSKDEADPKRLELFQHIKSSGVTLLTIINDILDLSKIESGKLAVESAPFASGDLFDSVANIYENLSHEKDVKFSYRLSPLLPGQFIGDIVRIKQILFNLLNNALKFTPNGGTIELAVDYDREKELLRCSVKDSGVGIARENLEKIFNAFEQEDVSTTRKFGGTGLGLAICSRLVEMMGGSLDVESALGKGSTFAFSIAIPACYDERENDALSKSDLPDTFTGHILVVEDNKTNQALLGIYLDMFGISYDIANDGQEAVAAFERSHYDLILMDENMPNMNGIEATFEIRKIEHNSQKKMTPIVAVTANALSGEKERFINAGMDDYLSKPFNEDDIKNILQTHLSTH